MKNQLVQYPGGGDSNRIWEWNFVLFDSEGRFHNLVSTGTKGIKTSKEAEALTIQGAENVYTYDLTKEAEVLNFLTENTDDNAIKISKLINIAYGDELIKIICKSCGEKVSPGETQHVSSKGDGSVDIVTERICNDCFLSGSCQSCHEYFGSDNSGVKFDIESLTKWLQVEIDPDFSQWLNEQRSKHSYCLGCTARQYQELQQQEQADT